MVGRQWHGRQAGTMVLLAAASIAAPLIHPALSNTRTHCGTALPVLLRGSSASVARLRGGARAASAVARMDQWRRKFPLGMALYEVVFSAACASRNGTCRN